MTERLFRSLTIIPANDTLLRSNPVEAKTIAAVSIVLRDHRGLLGLRDRLVQEVLPDLRAFPESEGQSVPKDQ